MMTMKKSLLALSVAAMPMAASADLQPMTDNDMGSVTGQEGVTIELSTALTIDQIEYSQDTNGSFLVDNVRVGGWNDGDKLDVSIDIDLADNGDAQIKVFSIGDLHPVNVGVDVGSIGLAGKDGSGNDTSATLISDLNMDMKVAQLWIDAKTENTVGDNQDVGSIQIRNTFAVKDLDVDFDVAAVTLENARMAGPGTMSKLQQDPSNTNWNNLAVSGVQVNAAVGAGSSIGVERGIGNGKAPADGDVLRVNVDNFAADMWMPTVKVGGSSIGSVAIHNMNVSDTEMAVYGR